MSDSVIKQRGFDVLFKELGMVDAERFIALINSEPFDYTKWRQKHLFEGMSIDEICDNADRFMETVNVD